MSLINEALKKAQTEQHGKNAPSARAPGISESLAKGGARRSPLVPVLAAVVVLGGGYYVWSTFLSESEEPAPVALRKPVSPPPARTVAPAAAQATPVAPPAVKVAAPAAPAEPAKAVAITPPPVPVAKTNAAVAALIEVMNVSLAKASTGRCVIDGQIHRVGERLSEEPRITLLRVNDDSLVFIDASGTEYTKEVSR